MVRVRAGAVRRIAVLMAAASVLGTASAPPSNALPHQTAPRSNALPRQQAAAARQGVTLGRSTIKWLPCKDFELQLFGAQCAMLRVPLDYSHPKGATIALALARVRHDVPASQFQGVMLTNPGGPGGAGRSLAALGEAVPDGVGNAYDWIGIDPRGVGASRPAVSCVNSYFHFNRPQYNPTAAALRNTWLVRSWNYAGACARRNGPILRHMTTAASARDMDSVRRALGATQINYYGYSYGTYLGQVYATLFPARVRRMVLDSNVDPRRVWYNANLDQDVAFQRNIGIWFRWLAAHHNSFHLGLTGAAVAARWYAIRGRLAAHPDHQIGPDEWTDVFLNAAYYQQTWVEEGWLFAGFVHNHAIAAVKQAYADSSGLGNDNAYAAYHAVQCTDVQWPKSWQVWSRDNARVNDKAPFETWANAWFNAPCLFWRAPARRPVQVDGRKVASALLIGETLDAATPFSGSIEVRRLFPNARLIALPGGTSHANSLNGDDCLDSLIAAYLLNGRLPARLIGARADTTCRPLPRPTP